MFHSIRSSYLSIVLSVLIITHSIKGEVHLNFMPDSIIKWSNENYLNFSDDINRDVPYANFTFNVLKDLKNVDFHIEAFAKAKNNDRYHASINVTYNLCDLLTMGSTDPIGVIVYRYVQRFGNIPQRCPIKKGIYKIYKIWIPEDLIPSNFPEAIWNANGRGYVIDDDNNNSIMIFNYTLSGNANYKEIKNDVRKMFIF